MHLFSPAMCFFPECSDIHTTSNVFQIKHNEIQDCTLPNLKTALQQDENVINTSSKRDKMKKL